MNVGDFVIEPECNAPGVVLAEDTTSKGPVSLVMWIGKNHEWDFMWKFTKELHSLTGTVSLSVGDRESIEEG